MNLTGGAPVVADILVFMCYKRVFLDGTGRNCFKYQVWVAWELRVDLTSARYLGSLIYRFRPPVMSVTTVLVRFGGQRYILLV